MTDDVLGNLKDTNGTNSLEVNLTASLNCDLVGENSGGWGLRTDRTVYCMGERTVEQEYAIKQNGSGRNYTVLYTQYVL